MIEQKSGRRLSSIVVLAILVGYVWFGCAEKRPVDGASDKTASSLEDVVPLTIANIRGHQMLYNEGWFVITSSRKALQYAKAKSIVSSGQAIRGAQQRVAARSAETKESIRADLQHSLDTGKATMKAGTDLSGQILKGTDALARSELTFASTTFASAWEDFIQGYLTLATRTEEDRMELVALPGGWYHSLRNDFSNIWGITKSLRDPLAGKIEVSWEAAFKQASNDFRAEYERSGQQGNTLMALGPILHGYLKALYHGAAAPAAKTLVHTGASGAGNAAAAVFLPVASTSVVAGRTVASVGLTFFYTGRTGVKLISPTIESGLLSGLALLSLGAVPITYVSGGTFGAMNQVAFMMGTPLYATGEAATISALQTGRYVGFVVYDAVSGTTKVVINQASSGVVLGYNALSAIPAHLFMGVTDSAILLAWEGPNLVIAKVTGRLKAREGSRASIESESAPASELPVGAVVDLNKLREKEGVKVEIISQDPAVIRGVIPQIPCDMREGDGTCQND